MQTVAVTRGSALPRSLFEGRIEYEKILEQYKDYRHKVRLISTTQPEDQELDKQDLIAFCARVSNPSNQMNKETSSKLLEYCASNAHWSVFEMVNVTLEITTSRAIVRQILRHRSFSFQEFSQRYAEGTGFIYVPFRKQDLKNRQNSIDEGVDSGDEQWWAITQVHHAQAAQQKYQQALKRGLAKELARSILPEGQTVSRIYMNGTLRSWIHYCQLRMGNGTQKEHKEIAEDCWKIICTQFPSIAGVTNAR